MPTPGRFSTTVRTRVESTDKRVQKSASGVSRQESKSDWRRTSSDLVLELINLHDGRQLALRPSGSRGFSTCGERVHRVKQVSFRRERNGGRSDLERATRGDVPVPAGSSPRSSGRTFPESNTEKRKLDGVQPRLADQGRRWARRKQGGASGGSCCERGTSRVLAGLLQDET